MTEVCQIVPQAAKSQSGTKWLQAESEHSTHMKDRTDQWSIFLYELFTNITSCLVSITQCQKCYSGFITLESFDEEFLYAVGTKCHLWVNFSWNEVKWHIVTFYSSCDHKHFYISSKHKVLSVFGILKSKRKKKVVELLGPLSQWNLQPDFLWG